MSCRKDFNIAEDLYLSSFPKEERRSLESIYKLLEEDIFEFVPIFFDEDFKGFANLWFFKDFTYIEHLAITPKERNRGYGTEFLKKLINNDISFLKQRIENIVLEVELPTNSLTQKRITFYERLGFKLLDDYYFQPPYEKDNEGVEMKIMLFAADKENNISFKHIQETLYANVYQIK
ncbi:MAG: GNAT family N-acetyltransferase [Bacteroidales bacterium]|nr:GNAT family N-acetyltransferase [Bacteroidales bacterium]